MNFEDQDIPDLHNPFILHAWTVIYLQTKTNRCAIPDLWGTMYQISHPNKKNVEDQALFYVMQIDVQNQWSSGLIFFLVLYCNQSNQEVMNVQTYYCSGIHYS